MENSSMSESSRTALNQKIVAGTDGASFFLYHPDDLRHRVSSPLAWTAYHFACQPEFEAGRLVAFDTGGDGGYQFRVTTGPLTEREQKWLVGSWDFRYEVRHGRVYLDGGYALPSDSYFEESEDHPEQWVTLANGKYRVTVSAIEWHSEPGALDDNGSVTDKALPSYVIQFFSVDTFDAIRVSRTPPRMETSKDWPPQESPSFSDYDTFGETDAEVQDRYVVLVNNTDAPVPGFHISMEVSDEFYEAVYGSVGNQVLPDRIEQLVIVGGNEIPGVGVLVEPSGGGKSGDEPWTMSFHAKRLVTVTTINNDKPWPGGDVEILQRPESSVSNEELKELKTAFAEYARSSAAYREAIEHPDFECERVLAMSSATGITHVLIHHVQIPLAEKLQLLSLSDADRVERLLSVVRQ